MKTRRETAKNTGEGDKKLPPPKKIRKKSKAAKKKRKSSSDAIISNLTTITTQVAVGLNSSLLNASEKPSDIQPPTAFAELSEVHPPAFAEAKGYFPDGSSDAGWEYTCADAENKLAGEQYVQEGFKIAGISTHEVSFPEVPQKPAIQTLPPPSKEDELDEFVQRIGSLLPQQLSQNPVWFVKITQTCFHEFKKTVSESKPNLLFPLYQVMMVCIDLYQVTMV